MGSASAPPNVSPSIINVHSPQYQSSYPTLEAAESRPVLKHDRPSPIRVKPDEGSWFTEAQKVQECDRFAFWCTRLVNELHVFNEVLVDALPPSILRLLLNASWCDHTHEIPRGDPNKTAFVRFMEDAQWKNVFVTDDEAAVMLELIPQRYDFVCFLLCWSLATDLRSELR